MNIKEIKSKIERATNIVVSSMVQPNVKIQCEYNIEQSVSMVALTSEMEGQNKEPVILVYNVFYNEEAQKISASAISRHYIPDHYGLSNIVYEPIILDEDFLNNMKQGMTAALTNYDQIIAADEAKKAEEAKAAEDKKDAPAEVVEPEVEAPAAE